MEDAPSWHYESSRHFSVRSAYKLAYNLNHCNDNETGSSTAPKGECLTTYDKGRTPIDFAASLKWHISVLNKRGPSVAGKSSLTKPVVGWLKVNTDVVFVASSRESSDGNIIRDYMDRLVRSESVKLLACVSVEEAEVCACVTGLKAALNLGNDL
ncbi:Ubiquitin carboxyl-terminal hydrolase 2 [Hordeum vulgare]|nr:Ubiquitin carboxyl-terminal hydrolase 2 [Hordeum vulgare]